MENVDRTALSEYGQSPFITALIQSMNEWIDPRADFDLFYDRVWNVMTAEGFGLDIWGKIVGIGRELEVEVPGVFFGFEGNGLPFDQGTFSPSETSTATYRLSDTAYRKLVLAKAMANIIRTTAPALNALLQNFFSGRGKCWCNDLGGMAMKYTFAFTLLPYERALIRSGGLLPRPAAVEIIVQEATRSCFGFDGNGLPFDQGTFISTREIYAI
jgi:hypothetical protein